MRQHDRGCPAGGPAVTRRRFLIDSAKGATAAGLATAAAPAPLPGADAAASKARVVIVTHPKAMDSLHRTNPEAVSTMLEAGMKALTGKASYKDAWQQVVQPDQRITIKWNEMGWWPIETRKEIRTGIADHLASRAGFDRSKVFLFSRDECEGDAATIVKIQIPNRGKEAKLRRLLVDFTDAIVNVPVLKTHDGMGVSISMKNHFGSIANPSDYHAWDDPKDMGKSIVELNAYPPIKDRTRLIIVDALRPQWDHGPLHMSRFRWRMNAMIFATDTVAVDAVGLDILEKKRRETGKFRRTKWQLHYGRRMLTYAEKMGLGVADLGRIEIERVQLKA